MEHNYRLIKNIAEDFVSHTYKNEIPDGYCFSLCYPLSVLFSLMGIEHEITFGKSQKGRIEVSHFWITFDHNGFILDPTIKQFNENESSVYLGEIHTNDTTKKYLKIEDIGAEEYSKTFESWADLLFQRNHRRPLLIDLENKLIALNVHASQVLFFFINKYGLKEKLLQSNFGLTYFKPISFVLQQTNLANEVLIRLNEKYLKYNQEIIELPFNA